MKKNPEQVTRYADMFAAMGTESRLRIMQLLLSAHPDGMVVGEIQEELGISASNLSHHLDKLKNEELVDRERGKGTFLRYTANTDALQELLGFLYAECCTRNQGDQARSHRHHLQIRRSHHARQDITEVVKEKYGQAALRVVAGGSSSCCGARSADAHCADPITGNLYDAAQTGELPETAVLATLGCGNPTALAQLNPGEIVLDLGSGGGIDVLLSARRVGPTGKAYGLDMTDEMLALANENKRKAGVENVEFLKGEIENIPLPDNSVDVIISNCVINLSADKDRVLARSLSRPQAGRPLRRLRRRDARRDPRRDPRSTCCSGSAASPALCDESEYRAKLSAAGFEDIDIEPTRIYHVDDARAVPHRQGPRRRRHRARRSTTKFMSAFIRAAKPARGPAADQPAARRSAWQCSTAKTSAGLLRALPVAVGSALHGGRHAPGQSSCRPPCRRCARMEFASGSQINVPIAILIWLMITPMMMKVDFTSVRNVGRRPAGLLVTLVVNWLVKPFSMAFLAWLFFRLVFAAFITPAEADQYIAGCIILAAAPCTAMVFVWSHLTDGDAAYTLVQVSVNDLIMLVALRAHRAVPGAPGRRRSPCRSTCCSAR